MHKTRALVVEHDTVSVRETEIRDIQDGEILIRADITTVSPGTELRVMQMNKQDTPDRAYVPGYTHVGAVIESKNPDYPVGTRLFSSGGNDTGEFARNWGGHIELAISTGGCVIPEGLDSLTASMAALAGISRHGVEHADVAPGTKVLVIGLGPIGQFVTRFLKVNGADVTGCDLVDRRIEICRAAGIDAFSTKEGLVESVEKNLPEKAPVVFDSTGSAAVLPLGIQCVADLPWDFPEDEPKRTYVIQGSYPGDIGFDYHDAFGKQLTFITPRNRQARDSQAFLELAAEGKIQADDLISRVCKPEEADKAYQSFRDPSQTPGTIAFDWSNT